MVLRQGPGTRAGNECRLTGAGKNSGYRVIMSQHRLYFEGSRSATARMRSPKDFLVSQKTKRSAYERVAIAIGDDMYITTPWTKLYFHMHAAS